MNIATRATKSKETAQGEMNQRDRQRVMAWQLGRLILRQGI